MGTYLCTASNGVPTSVVKRIQLFVHCEQSLDIILFIFVSRLSFHYKFKQFFRFVRKSGRSSTSNTSRLAPTWEARWHSTATSKHIHRRWTTGCGKTTSPSLRTTSSQFTTVFQPTGKPARGTTLSHTRYFPKNIFHPSFFFSFSLFTVIFVHGPLKHVQASSSNLSLFPFNKPCNNLNSYISILIINFIYQFLSSFYTSILYHIISYIS